MPKSICAHCPTTRTGGECPHCGTYWRGLVGYRIVWPATPVKAFMADLADKLGLRIEEREIVLPTPNQEGEQG